ncbi:MAG: MarR family transcriptional regulator [Gemmatimonadota bacterium]
MHAHDLIDRLRAEWKTERPELDTSSMEVVGRLLILGEHLRREADAALEPLELGYSEFGVLATLQRSGPPYRLRPATLLQTVLLNSGSMTACLDRLERRGLVERSPDPDDRRARLVHLLPPGTELVTEALELRVAAAVSFLRVLSDQESDRLIPLLKKLVLTHRPMEISE